ncbi:MAG: hypothetical protein H0V01_03575 [Bacteroidetes bacterium]|nr:hypothetical protein [Bacteroidota bacterium]HET6245532.1 hypothetical protein [Bacteroidia bacterium]
MEFIKNIKSNLISISSLVVIVIFILGVFRLVSEDKIYPTGDVIEYTIMTEAFYNHFSPDVREGDFETFKKAYTKIADWSNNEKAITYDAAQQFVSEKNHQPLDYDYAFFVSEKGKKFSCHFFAYSLINVPSRILCAVLDFNPLIIHQLTNLMLIVICSFLFFRYSGFNKLYTTLFVFMFYFSTNYWYLSWQHPEVFTVCFSSLGLFLFLSERRYWGLFLMSIAALQNQPMAILIAGLAVYTLIKAPINIKNLVKLGLSTIIVLGPSLFYYYHFGETNLIKYQGALSFDYVTVNRVLGLFFDINQGAILAIPLVLFLYIFLLIRKFLTTKPPEYILEIIIVVFTVFSVCIAATIDNWNHGQSVVNRYVTYFSGMILVHFAFLLYEIKNLRLKISIASFALITQIATVIYHNNLSDYDWSTNVPKPISVWVLENYPKFYNPDPVIFLNRYFPNAAYDYSSTPAYFMKTDGTITKILIHKQHTDNLEIIGLNKAQIDSINENTNFINNWAYLNVDNISSKFLPKALLIEIDNVRKTQNMIEIIKATPNWYNSVIERAEKEGVSEEQALIGDARYVLKIDPVIQIGTTKEEKINIKIVQIKANPEWLEMIKLKARESNTSLDTALYYDAKWIIEEELKK